MAEILPFQKPSSTSQEGDLEDSALRYELDYPSIILIVLGIILRVPGLFGDLWLDEIWGLEAARSIHSPLDFITGQLDGHLTLYTVYLWIVSGSDNPIVLRLLSFIFGCGLLFILALLIPASRRVERYTLLFLVAVSYPFILYSSEARGYSGMLFFGALSLLLLERQKMEVSEKEAILFFISNSLAFLFHLSYVQFFGALLLYGAVLAVGRLSSTKEQWSFLYRLFGPIILFLIGAYIVVLRLMPQGTGTLVSYPETIIDAIAVTIGAPLLSEHALAAGTLTLAASLAAIVLLVVEVARQKSLGLYRWIFFCSALFIMPAAVVFLLEPRILHPRYFLMSMLTSYMVYACLVSDLQDTARQKFLSIVGLGLLFLFGQASYLVPFFGHGKGEYSSALRRMSSEIPQDQTGLVSSDHDFRTGKVFRYYQDQLQIKNLSYTPSSEDQDELPAYFIVHSEDRHFDPPQRLSLGHGKLFVLRDSYESGSLAGFRWFVYSLLQEGRSGH